MKTLTDILEETGAPEAQNEEEYRKRMKQLGIAEYMYTPATGYWRFENGEWSSARRRNPRVRRDTKGNNLPLRQFHLFMLQDDSGLGEAISYDSMTHALVGAGAIDEIAEFKESYDALAEHAQSILGESRALFGADSDTTSALRATAILLQQPNELSRKQLYGIAVERGRQVMERYREQESVPLPQAGHTPIRKTTG